MGEEITTTTSTVLGRLPLEELVSIVKAMSDAPDPAEFSRIFTDRVGATVERDRFVYLSRRGLEAPYYRVTRNSDWDVESNPWTELEHFPVFEGGILGELVYANEPRLIDDLEIDASDPCYEHLEGMRSLITLPEFDKREAMNMAILLKREPNGFDAGVMGELVWTSNLFGRALHTSRLGAELEEAYRIIDREMHAVSRVQQSLLPKAMPSVPTLSLAASYEAAHHAGGDYYDFIPLEDGKLGILMADVCGHGAAAAVLMAILHAILHTSARNDDPGATLLRLNETLLAHYTSESRAFVTAFYGIYDPTTRRMFFSSAGHEHPRVYRPSSGEMFPLATWGNLPLGVHPADAFTDAEFQFEEGDVVVLYTDGVTEAGANDGALFGTEGLEQILRKKHASPEETLRAILDGVHDYTGGKPQHDDRAIIVGHIS